MVIDYMLDEVLDKIQETIGILKFDNNKILIDTDDKLHDCITLKTAVILLTGAIKDDTKFLYISHICRPKCFDCFCE